MPAEFQSVVSDEIQRAVEFSWKLLTKSPPAVLCKPPMYSRALHEKHEKAWKGEGNSRLVYFQPVILMEPGGNVLHKGLVGNC